MRTYPDIITFSHLRWDFVYQRPQHLLSRMATRQRVFYIEEPLYEEGTHPRWEQYQPEPNITVCRLRTPNPAPGFHDDHLSVFTPLLQQLIDEHAINEHIVWMYTPMALPVAQLLDPQAVIYDCMDELSAFLHAPPALLAREAALLNWADIVFTGGPSLFRAKSNRHENVNCFPSSVDAVHFRQARSGVEAADMAGIPHPRLGFYGVIDERVDLALLAALAEAHPEWQIVMVGPVVKIDPASLPRAANIHYLGQRGYRELPSYLAGWDVCLLPFALNDATRFISPTKTLEYMAAERPIVSTPITDVAEPYGDIVYLGHTHAEFIDACERALAADEAEHAGRAVRMRAVLAQTSWDTTAQAMRALIDQILMPGLARQAA